MKLPSFLTLAALSLTTTACLLPHELKANADYHRYGILPKRQAFPNNSSSRRDMPTGQGDRFEDGKKAPAGLGVDDRDLGSILNVNEVRSALKGLAAEFDEVKLFDAPFITYEKATVHGAVVGDAPRAFLMSGIHARERGGPDNLIYFVSDLLRARKSGSGVKYGGKAYSHNDVLKVLATGFVVVPLVNPDGVAYDQNTSSCWRKNRNPESAILDTDIGIDLNRNFDFLWDYEKSFNLSQMYFVTASDIPAAETFHGTHPFSEPETRNVAWVMDSFKQLSWFLDLHSYGGDILWGWGDDNAQTLNPLMNFHNSSYDGTRGPTGDEPGADAYQEYMIVEDVDRQQSLAQQMQEAMQHSGSIPYSFKQSCNLYTTSGVSTDYALSRYYAHHCGANKIQGFTVEFGQASEAGPCPFYPSKDEYHESMRQVATGLMEFLMVAGAAEVEQWQC